MGKHKTKEEEQWFLFSRDKNAHVAQRVALRHYGKGVTLVKKSFETKKDLEDDLLPFIDLKDDLPPLIDFIPMGELLEEAIGNQNNPIYHLILEEALTNEKHNKLPSIVLGGGGTSTNNKLPSIV